MTEQWCARSGFHSPHFLHHRGRRMSPLFCARAMPYAMRRCSASAVCDAQADGWGSGICHQQSAGTFDVLCAPCLPHACMSACVPALSCCASVLCCAVLCCSARLWIWEGGPVLRHIARRDEAAGEVAVHQHCNLRRENQHCWQFVTLKRDINRALMLSTEQLTSTVFTVKLKTSTAASVNSPAKPPRAMSLRLLDTTAHQETPTTASTITYMILPKCRSQRMYLNKSNPAMFAGNAPPRRGLLKSVKLSSIKETGNFRCAPTSQHLGSFAPSGSATGIMPAAFQQDCLTRDWPQLHCRSQIRLSHNGLQPDQANCAHSWWVAPSISLVSPDKAKLGKPGRPTPQLLLMKGPMCCVVFSRAITILTKC